MAHGVHLQPAELDRMAAAKCGVACCPLSNFFFANGDFQLVGARQRGVRVGLGTDMAGGYSPSMLSACRHAVCASKVVGRTRGAASEIAWKDAFWHATVGGACALGLEAHIGSFTVGAQFDAVVVQRFDVPFPSVNAAVHAAQQNAASRHPAEPTADVPAAAHRGKRKAVDEAPSCARRSHSFAEDLEKYVNLGDDRQVLCVVVAGKVAHAAPGFVWAAE